VYRTFATPGILHLLLAYALDFRDQTLMLSFLHTVESFLSMHQGNSLRTASPRYLLHNEYQSQRHAEIVLWSTGPSRNKGVPAASRDSTDKGSWLYLPVSRCTSCAIPCIRVHLLISVSIDIPSWQCRRAMAR